MDTSRRRERLREVIDAGGCVRPAPVCDPATARMAEILQFDAGMLAGSMASLAVLGAPDLVLMTLSELAAQVRRICRASGLPLIVDADHGFGNALNVMRTVEELEVAGASALTIEDTDLPHRFGSPGTSLISVEEGVAKLQAALSARSDPRLIVVGRTSAPRLTEPSEAVRRARAYAATGVDALFLSGVTRRATLDAIAEVVRVPIFLGASGPEVHDPDYLASRGVRVWLHGHQPIIAALEAAHACLRALKEGSAPPPVTSRTSSEAVLAELLRQEEYDDAAAKFLMPPDSSAKAAYGRH